MDSLTKAELVGDLSKQIKLMRKEMGQMEEECSELQVDLR